jgi:lipopolysaccharide/colanic/teichoic acid biosynthesis glycosyltransferase
MTQATAVLESPKNSIQSLFSVGPAPAPVSPEHAYPFKERRTTVRTPHIAMANGSGAHAGSLEHTIWAEGNQTSNYQVLKRAMDIVGSLALLVALSPVLLIVLAVLTVTTKGKPFFSQERVGLCGRRFRMFKFRTMRLDADKLQHLVQNEKDGPIFKNRIDPRITKLGRWLRKTSIDELPQLLNVLLGDMALVGPRPPVPKEVAKYKPWQRRRLAVKPGLTCLWQISGRSEIGFEDWVRLDIWYLQNQTLWTDVKLLVRTPLKVITCKGAY